MNNLESPTYFIILNRSPYHGLIVHKRKGSDQQISPVVVIFLRQGDFRQCPFFLVLCTVQAQPKDLYTFQSGKRKAPWKCPICRVYKISSSRQNVCLPVLKESLTFCKKQPFVA